MTYQHQRPLQQVRIAKPHVGLHVSFPPPLDLPYPQNHPLSLSLCHFPSKLISGATPEPWGTKHSNLPLYQPEQLRVHPRTSFVPDKLDNISPVETTSLRTFVDLERRGFAREDDEKVPKLAESDVHCLWDRIR